MKVKIVKEMKRSDGLWRFACGDVFTIVRWGEEQRVNVLGVGQRGLNVRSRSRWDGRVCMGGTNGVALVSNLWLSLWSLELAIELHCVETTLESTLCIMNNGGPRTVASWKVKIGVQNTLLHTWERTRLANAMIKELVRQGGASFTTENLEGALFT